jgi:hypothetical protein
MHRGRADADAERRCENGSGDRTVLVCSSYHAPKAAGNAPYVTGVAE